MKNNLVIELVTFVVQPSSNPMPDQEAAKDTTLNCANMVDGPFSRPSLTANSTCRNSNHNPNGQHWPKSESYMTTRQHRTAIRFKYTIWQFKTSSIALQGIHRGRDQKMQLPLECITMQLSVGVGVGVFNARRVRCIFVLSNQRFKAAYQALGRRSVCTRTQSEPPRKSRNWQTLMRCCVSCCWVLSPTKDRW